MLFLPAEFYNGEITFITQQFKEPEIFELSRDYTSELFKEQQNKTTEIVSLKYA